MDQAEKINIIHSFLKERFGVPDSAPAQEQAEINRRRQQLSADEAIHLNNQVIALKEKLGIYQGAAEMPTSSQSGSLSYTILFILIGLMGMIVALSPEFGLSHIVSGLFIAGSLIVLFAAFRSYQKYRALKRK